MNDSRDRGWLRDGSPRARSLALGVLILVATGLRITQAGRLECISRDGVGYVRFARELAEDARYYLRAELSQPGYSAAVLATQRTIGPWLSGDPVLAWERSGQFVAVLGGVAVVPLIYLLAAQLFDQRIALIAGGLAAIWPFAVDSSADVLTDQPHLALYLACVVAAAGALRRGRAVYLLPVGVLAGVAYLFRQEALALPIGVGAWWMVSARSRVAVRSAGVLLLLAGFALAVAPYVAATGKLTHKKSLRQVILGQPEPQAAAREHDATARAAAVRGVEIPLRAAEQWARCGQYVIGLLAILGWVWRGVPRSAAGPRRLVLLLAGLHVLAVLARGRSYGEISTRYMLIPTAFSIPWAAAALDALVSRLRAGPAAAVVLAVAAILIAPLRDAPNHGKAALRSAGDWLRANSLPQDVIAADSKLSPLGFYSDRRMAWPEEGTADERWAKLSGERPQWYCDDPKRSYAEGAEQGLLERCRRAYAIGTPAFEAGGATETTIRMYRTGGR